MRSHRRHALAFAILVVGALSNAPPASPASIENGSLDADDSGWTPGNEQVSQVWSPLDPADPTPSGSLAITTITTSGGTSGSFQCLEDFVPPPTFVRADVLVPDDVDDVVTGHIVVWYYAQPGCLELLELAFAPDFVEESEGWQEILFPLEPPSGAASLQVQLGVSRDPDPGSSTVHFDNVVVPEPGAEGTASAGAALLLLARRRRRR
jgi:hypothetical protein